MELKYTVFIWRRFFNESYWINKKNMAYYEFHSSNIPVGKRKLLHYGISFYWHNNSIQAIIEPLGIRIRQL